MSFLPRHFHLPTRANADGFVVRPITHHDVIMDYDAVMTSREHLWERFGKVWGWPPEDLSLEQDLIDLAWHQKEAQLRSSFNFAVMNHAETQLLGCIYIDPPSGDEKVEAENWFWGRQSELGNGLEAKLAEFVLDWLSRDWPFGRVSLNGTSRWISE